MTTARGSHLHVVQSIEPLQGGGLGRAALELHEAFLAAGARSSLVATHGGAQPHAPARPQVREFARRAPEKFFFSPELRQQAPALVADDSRVHAHGFYVFTNWMLGREARRRRVPLVCHPHGFFEPWILARSRARKRLVHALFEDANFRAARLWRALTEKEAGQIRAQGITAPVVVAPNGVHLEPFDLPASALDVSRWARKTRPRLLFLGRLHPKKGLPLLVPAWAQSGAARRGWELIIAGPDEDGHRAEIEALVRSHDAGDSVSLPGTISGLDKTALLRSADAFILPSHSEGFSVAILEAMACRVPVAATHACNFPELARSGGWLFEPTPESIADALSHILNSSADERRDRGKAARALVERRFTWPSIAQTILDACDQHC